MRYVLAIAVAVAVAVIVPADLAHAQSVCQPGLIDQRDMAGSYLSMENQMRIDIYPCGTTSVLWSNAYGTHRAYYTSVQRMNDGTIMATVGIPDPVVRSLDNRNALGLKPAEPGYIQAMTIGPFGDNPRVYRLKKLA